ncbi:MAG: type II toxin-antitoxin system VapC family toxin [Actinomycetota bacterium]
MSLIYADTSALARAYFSDEPDHQQLKEQLLEGGGLVLSSELARPELASAVQAAHRAGRLSDPVPVLNRFDADCGPDGPLTLLVFEPAPVFSAAYALISKHPLKTLDSLHLAVALEERSRAGEDLVFVSRDDVQRTAARAEGLRTG